MESASNVHRNVFNVVTILAQHAYKGIMLTPMALAFQSANTHVLLAPITSQLYVPLASVLQA